MRKTLRFIITFLVIICLFFGCSKSDSLVKNTDFFNYSDYEEVLKYATPVRIYGYVSNPKNIKKFLEQDKKNVRFSKIEDYDLNLAELNIKAPDNSLYKLFLVYDDDYSLYDSVYYSRIFKRNELKSITKGITKSDVIKVIKDDFIEYHSEEENSECIVYINDGSALVITFENDIVTSAKYEKDSFKFYQTIIKK